MENRLKSLLALAIKVGATDIHLTNRDNDTQIEMRVSGKIKNVIAKKEDKKLITYLQYLANLDVGNAYIPQTGQFEMELAGQLLSLRFSLVGGLNFESGVLRILNTSLNLDGRHLSLLESQNNFFNSLLKEKDGLVLFAGPTGSGKTTSLYTLLKQVRGKKIYTLEDPIEIYQKEYVQLEINETLNFGFKEGVRQILRHDPDIIMIGEIRDEKAAKMALRAANTGHLVFSSVHASSSRLVLERMKELGINEKILYEVLKAIIFQRLCITRQNKKVVFYEIMNSQELNYYHLHKLNTSSFLSVEKQIKEAEKNGYLL